MEGENSKNQKGSDGGRQDRKGEKKGRKEKGKNKIKIEINRYTQTQTPQG